MIRALAVLALVAAVVAAFVVTQSGDEGGRAYEVELDNAFGLVEGGDLKIGGVVAGKTESFEIQRKPPYRILAKVRVSQPGFDSLRTDAECSVRQQSLIGEYFIDCDVGKAREELPDGGRIPVERTSSTIPLDLIQNVMRRPYRERWRIILNELGTGLAGRPGELNEVIRRAHPALRETSKTIAILARQNRMISGFIEDADRVSAEVHPVREDVARWARESSKTASIQASRRDELGRYWNRLPTFLDELEPTMAQLEATADEQIPTLRKLGAAAPALESFLAAVPDFARNSRTSLGALGEASVTGRRALRATQEEIRELNSLARSAPRFAKPLRQFLQAIDDRSRSVEDDPEAGRRAPPAPDKTAYRRGQGYTGMENLLNYIFWQTTAINAYDDVGHVLRIIISTGTPCSRYQHRPPRNIQRQCASWTGPFQPGVTAPDPTEGDEPRRRLEALAKENEERAKRGDVPKDGPGGIRATKPKPGERDPSKPQIRFPDGIRAILGGRNPTEPPVDPRLPNPVPQRADEPVDPVIDFLLAP